MYPRLVFVVDSADPDRFQEARTQLDIAHFDELEYLPLLVFANKQDLPSAATAEDVAERLGLHRMQGRKWFVQSACAASGVGLSEGMALLVVVAAPETPRTAESKNKCVFSEFGKISAEFGQVCPDPTKLGPFASEFGD